MKSKSLVTSFTALALMSGCASTSSYTHQPLELMTDHVSTYDETKSFALNVAEKTGKTYGLRDRDIPEDAQSRIHNADLGLTLLAGGLGNGVLGLSGVGLIYGGAISARNWRPMYVLTDIAYPYDGDYPLNDAVEVLMDSKLRSVFKTERLDGASYVGLAHTHRNQESNYNVFFSGERCNEVLSQLGNESGLPSSFGDHGVFGAIKFSEPTCNIPFKVSLVGRVLKEEQEHIVIVMEQIGTYSLVSDIAVGFNGYSVIPDTYLDLDGTRYSHDMPFVMHDGYLHVFSRNFPPLKIN